MVSASRTTTIHMVGCIENRFAVFLTDWGLSLTVETGVADVKGVFARAALVETAPNVIGSDRISFTVWSSSGLNESERAVSRSIWMLAGARPVSFRLAAFTRSKVSITLSAVQMKRLYTSDISPQIPEEPVE